MNHKPPGVELNLSIFGTEDGTTPYLFEIAVFHISDLVVKTKNELV